MQRSAGNRATVQHLASSQPAAIQRMSLVVGNWDDVIAKAYLDYDASTGQDTIAELGHPPAPDVLKPAAVGGPVTATRGGFTATATGSAQLPLMPGRGPLSKIGLAEELRVFGHGQTGRDNIVLQINGTTAEALARRLIELGLPKRYAGEIYLSGCDAAVGGDESYLSKFFAAIHAHSPAARARGNLGKSVTREDGSQWVRDPKKMSEADYALLDEDWNRRWGAAKENRKRLRGEVIQAGEPNANIPAAQWQQQRKAKWAEEEQNNDAIEQLKREREANIDRAYSPYTTEKVSVVLPA
jgi:hypothetical protein